MGWWLRLVAVALVVPATVGMQAKGQPDCVGQDRATGACDGQQPAGQVEDPSGNDGDTGPAQREEPADSPQRSETPPGLQRQQPDEPGTSGEEEEPAPRVRDTSAPPPPASRETTAPSGTDTGPDVEAPGAAEPTVAPPPPIPAGIRFLQTRLAGGGLEVFVEEHDVRGIDGGWSVIVELAGGRVEPAEPTVVGRGVRPRAIRAEGPGEPATLVAITGQRSPQRYAARYRGTAQLEGIVGKPTIVVTLIQ